MKKSIQFSFVLFILTLSQCQEVEIEIEIEYEEEQDAKESRSLINPPTSPLPLNLNMVLNNDVTLQLKAPPVSIFGTDFKYVVATDGGLVDDTPSKSNIRSLENHIFVDQENDAVMNVDTSANGLILLEGVVENMFISQGNNKPNGGRPTYTAKKMTSSEDSKTDYIDLHRNITTYPNPQTRAAVTAEGETWVVVDYDHAAQFNFNRERILSYLATLYRTVNNRYATFSEPKISFAISGITVISSRGAQPFLENNRIPDGYDMDKVLADFSIWAYSSILPIFPQVDMAALISNTDLQQKDSSGTYQKNTAGIAYMKASCWKDTVGKRLLATSVSEDRGAFYDGAYTVAHEFAHNLASPHDGFGESTSCAWSEGYIMSYNGWGTTKKFYFSPCSIDVMNKFILSSGGACLRIKGGNSPEVNANAASDVGDQFDMTSLCIKYTQSPQAVTDPSKSPSDLCKNLMCKFPTPGKPEGWISTYTVNHPPGDNSVCGNGGRCQNGECIGDQGVRKDLTEQCIRYSGKATAVPDTSATAAQQCQTLQCKYTDPQQPGWIWTWKYSGPPDYGTVCDGGRGRCINGACV